MESSRCCSTGTRQYWNGWQQMATSRTTTRSWCQWLVWKEDMDHPYSGYRWHSTSILSYGSFWVKIFWWHIKKIQDNLGSRVDIGRLGGGGDESAALATAAATEVLGWGYFTPSGKQLYHLSLRARCMSRTSWAATSTRTSTSMSSEGISRPRLLSPITPRNFLLLNGGGCKFSLAAAAAWPFAGPIKSPASG